MLGTKFILDEEKIKRDGKYDLNSVYSSIDKVAQIAHLTKISNNHFVFTGEQNAPAYLGIFVFNYMSKYEWFTTNLKEWLWLDDDEGNSDLIGFFKKEGKGVWV